jgi:hypothetical protein
MGLCAGEGGAVRCQQVRNGLLPLSFLTKTLQSIKTGSGHI